MALLMHPERGRGLGLGAGALSEGAGGQKPAPSLFSVEAGVTTEPVPRRLDGRRVELERQFWTFHHAHPEVYSELVRLALIWRSRGKERWGVKSAFEVLRWERRIRGLPDEREAFKLNNNHTAFYARLLMEREPDLAGLFATRAEARWPQHGGDE